jgi:PhoD-like phosphatase
MLSKKSESEFIMPTALPIPTSDFRLRLPQDGPLLGSTRWAEKGDAVLATLFATPDDSESDPALALFAYYRNTAGKRQFAGAVKTVHPSDGDASAPYFVIKIEIPATEFVNGTIQLEVLTLHKTLIKGEIFTLPGDEEFKDSKKIRIDYDKLRATLDTRLQKNQAMLIDPKPSSHSFERRSNRSRDEAIVTVRLPPMKTEVEKFKFIATTCRYPGFAFESNRVDTASYNVIAEKHKDASGMLMLGDQIYADATASLFDNLTSIEKFQERYHKMFRSPGFAKAVRSIPCYMTGDDHEFSDSWSVPDDLLKPLLHAAAQQSYGVYQLSHSPFTGVLNEPPYDYSFTCGPVAVYVMDTISNRNTQVPGKEVIVSAEQLTAFEDWLTKFKSFDYVILATGGVVAPGFQIALGANDVTDVSRAQGWENWQAFEGQRIKLLDILSRSNAKILLISGDYHCAAVATIKKGKDVIAKAVVAPPAYAPMRYTSKTIGMLAKREVTGGYEITVDKSVGSRDIAEGSGFAVITIENGDWDVKFETRLVADI